MKNVAVFVLSAVIAFSASKSAAAKFEAECPEEIKTKQSGTPVKGWTADVDMINARQIFTGLVLFSGHPKDGATLMPDETAPAKAGEKPGDGAGDIVYTLTASETYMACQYTGTLVRLIKKLPKDVKSCQVKFSATLGHVQMVACD
jgi:hypothetical protein